MRETPQAVNFKGDREAVNVSSGSARRCERWPGSGGDCNKL